MPDIVAEQMSAWLDDELPEAELELLMARLGRSPAAHGQLGRYGLIGAALRGGPPAPDAWQLAERVRRALDAGQESAVGADRLPAATDRDQRWQDNVVPFAAAATVLLTLFLMATIKSPALAPEATAKAGRTGMFMPAAAAAEPQGLQQFPVQTLLSRQRLTDYLVLHGEYTGTLSVQVADSHIVNDRGYATAAYTRSGFPSK
ncbi:MAG: sigma-E factor negative regulatory protein RseA [Pseudomonadota bacterium]|jgi:negative regulator of sigma E activity|nr:sigma-E factor negative regulatory protein RseA [Pseudomonadota bacterium]